MQRLFSMFPQGVPGIALLLLRAAVALMVFDKAHVALPELSAWEVGALLLQGSALIAGLFTPVAALAACAIEVDALGDIDSASWLTITISILNALALAFLGPGAYSIDALRFGRRIVVLPPP